MNSISLQKITRLSAAIVFCLSAFAARAQSTQGSALELDPAQTQIEWTLGAVLHTVHGSFRLKKGTIHFDPAAGTVNGAVVVDSTSGASGNESRDRKMHKSILESDRFPEITFVPDRLDGKVDAPGTSKLGLHGLFTIHGASHEIVLPIEVRMTQGQFTATTSFAVPYIQWGMKNPSTLLLRVHDKVDITIRAVGRIPASAAH